MGANEMGQDGSVGRETLPIPDRPHVGLVTYDAKDPATSFPPIEPLRPPVGAPNVLVVLIDDCGFGLPLSRTPASRRGFSYCIRVAPRNAGTGGQTAPAHGKASQVRRRRDSLVDPVQAFVMARYADV